MLDLWLKALHIIAVIAWMAGMLYLPRLFVYHADAAVGSDTSETFKVMEYRLLRYITTPAMLAALILGLALIYRGYEGGLLKAGWLHAKLLLVLLLMGMHGFLAATVRAFREDRNTRPARFYRLINEVPTLLMIGIVILAVVKPF
jgi:putative membrane protein